MKIKKKRKNSQNLKNLSMKEKAMTTGFLVMED
jgi:hypothetical protein